MTHTNADAEQHVITAIEATGVATRDEYDVPAIARAAHDAAGGTWDISLLDEDVFWKLVEEHVR